MSVITHSCGAKWTGKTRAHCAGCHETFSSDSAFDKHRKGLRCHTPESVGLVAREGAHGTIWGHPGTDPRRGD